MKVSKSVKIKSLQVSKLLTKKDKFKYVFAFT